MERAAAVPVTGRPLRVRADVADPRPSVSPTLTPEEEDSPPETTPPRAGAGRADPERVALDDGVRLADRVAQHLGELGALDPDDELPPLLDPPDELPPPEEPPEDDDPPLVRGIACADAMAGTASPMATTNVVIALIDLVMACPLAWDL